MTRRSQIKPQLWEQMRRSYLTGSVTLEELSRLYGVGYSTIRKHASANDWFTHKRSRTVLAEAEVRNDLSRRLLTQAGGLQQTAPYCIPMPASKHYDVLIKLMQLNMRLKQTTPHEQESPRPDNVIPLHQVPRSRVKLTKARREIEQSF